MYSYAVNIGTFIYYNGVHIVIILYSVNQGAICERGNNGYSSILYFMTGIRVGIVVLKCFVLFFLCKTMRETSLPSH